MDCLIHAHNIEALTQLEHLYYLNFSVFELEDAEILKAETFQNLKMLAISAEKKIVNLTYLKDYSQLHTLIVGGKIKNLEAIGHLAAEITPCDHHGGNTMALVTLQVLYLPASAPETTSGA